MKNKNIDLLIDFNNYCQAHPEMRFWQALRNWCGWGFVLVSTNKPQWRNPHDEVDTFYWEDNKTQ